MWALAVATSRFCSPVWSDLPVRWSGSIARQSRWPRPRAELVLPEVAARYNAPDTRLDPQALAEVLDWLAAHV